MIIGLTGTKASGKGVVAGILKERGFVYCSLSDIVREEAVGRGLKNYNIKDLQDIGNGLRKEHGNGILARMTLEKLKNEIKNKKNCVIDGIRNPSEISELKKLKEFILIAVDAPLEIRFKRLLERKRESDPKDFKGFTEMDKRDRGLNEDEGNASGQQVGKCIEIAGIKLYNDSSVEVLKDKTEKILKDLRC